ncbi:hypothetical protein GCM10020220_091300 [Nonomuraea rubra]|uniref:hypothetical protein n=1 Tax=Nonomuraea rubra TaxID=46180 RepID=UPI0031E91B20
MLPAEHRALDGPARRHTWRPSGTARCWSRAYAEGRIEGTELDLAVETAYPWDGDVRLTVERAPDGPYGLLLRIPAWSRGATLTINGEPLVAERWDGWLRVERRWKAGDEVRLTLPMPVRAHGSHTPTSTPTRGTVSLARGPLVYCVEQQDSPDAAVDDLVIGVPDIVNANIGRRDEAVGADPHRHRRSPALRRALPGAPAGAGAPGDDGHGDLRPLLPLGQPRPRSHAGLGQDPRRNLRKEGEMRRSAALTSVTMTAVLALSA